jgi:hypothetical protein
MCHCAIPLARSRHITQPHTHWEVHFSRRSSAIQHDILVSQSVISTAAQTVRKKACSRQSSVPIPDVAFRSSEAHGNFVCSDEPFRVLSRTQHEQIQTVQFQNRKKKKKRKTKAYFWRNKMWGKATVHVHKAGPGPYSEPWQPSAR